MKFEKIPEYFKEDAIFLAFDQSFLIKLGAGKEDAVRWAAVEDFSSLRLPRNDSKFL